MECIPSAAAAHSVQSEFVLLLQISGILQFQVTLSGTLVGTLFCVVSWFLYSWATLLLPSTGELFLLVSHSRDAARQEVVSCLDMLVCNVCIPTHRGVVPFDDGKDLFIERQDYHVRNVFKISVAPSYENRDRGSSGY